MSLKLANEIIAILVFLVASWIGIYILFGKRIKRSVIQSKFYKDDLGKASSIANKRLEEEKALGYIDKLQLELTRARVDIKAESFLVLNILLVIVGFIAGKIMFGSFLFAIGLGFLGFILPKLFLNGRREKFVKKFDTEMVKALRRMGSVMRVGGSLEQALVEVSESNMIPDIVKFEFNNVLAAYKAGFNITESFYRLYKSVGSKNTLYLCASMDIQMETGGDKSEVMESIAQQIELKNRSESEAKAALSEITSSVNMLAAIPVFFLVLLQKMNPGHFQFFTSSFLGQVIGFVLVTMVVGGYIIMRKMVKTNF